MSDRVFSDDVYEECYNCARVERALKAMGATHEERIKRIAQLEVRQPKSEELHRLRRAVVCYEFLLGVRERFPNQSDRANLPTHVKNPVRYYRKNYGGAVLGRRLAQCSDRPPTKRRGELQSQIKKWRREDPDRYSHRSISYQACCSELRVLVGGDRLHDIDMVNCFPTIGIHMAEVYGLTSDALQAYVTRDREGILREIMALHRVSRKTSKELPLTILHGGSYDSFLAKNRIRTSQRVPLMAALEAEATQLRIAALRSTLPLEQSVVQAREYQKTVKGKSDEGEFGSTEVDRSLFSLIMQTREARILDTMIKHCAKRGVVVESLQFDGLLINCPESVQMPALLDELESAIKTHCEVPMKLVEKELYRLPHQPIIDQLARV